MRFKNFHNEFFSSIDGAYSRVTEREYFDSQITLTDAEAEMVINHFGIDNIQVGNVKSKPEKASKVFTDYATKETLYLNLVFPKPVKTELRLYISSKAGFKPLSGNIWFLFIDQENRLVIGDLSEQIWNSLDQEDEHDPTYQIDIDSTLSSRLDIDVDPNGKIIKSIVGSREVISRDPKLAAMRFQLSGNKCEINPTHKTFIAERTTLPYVEAHHFIPIKFQHLFEKPLDNLHNIVSLCPNCHRAIHHAVIDCKFGLISTIYEKRPEMHTYTLEYIAQYYNALTIV